MVVDFLRDRSLDFDIVQICGRNALLHADRVVIERLFFIAGHARILARCPEFVVDFAVALGDHVAPNTWVDGVHLQELFNREGVTLILLPHGQLGRLRAK